MQKDQQFAVGSRLMVQGPRDVRPPHIPAPAIRPSIPNVPRYMNSPIYGGVDNGTN